LPKTAQDNEINLRIVEAVVYVNDNRNEPWQEKSLLRLTAMFDLPKLKSVNEATLDRRSTQYLGPDEMVELSFLYESVGRAPVRQSRV